MVGTLLAYQRLESVLEHPSFDAKVGFLTGAHAGALAHSQSNLLAHLVATCEMLRGWGAREAVCDAGLFHSVYGTESYQASVVSLAARNRVRAIIGAEAEEMAYVFGVMVKRTFYEALTRSGNFEVSCRLTGARLALDEARVADLCQLAVANWLEQRPRVPAEYRLMKRAEFGAMRRFLPIPARTALDDAYGFPC